MEATKKEAIERTISEVTQRYCGELKNCIFKDLKELHREPLGNDDRDNRAGAYGSVIDLECNDIQYAGKMLHSIFFDPGTDPSYVRSILTKFFEEIKIIRKMDHPNVVKFQGIYYQQDSLLPVLVMEKMECDLDQYLTTSKKGSMPDYIILRILLDVSKGLVYLHEEMKVAHRDLSSKNILLTTKLSAKIADFGSARVLDKPGGWNVHSKLTVKPGTLDFMPPEALEEPPQYTVSVDIFSFGCVIIHVCTHTWPSPIGRTNQERIVSEFERRQKYILKINDVSLIPIIKQCLEDKSIKRPTARYIKSLLEAKILEDRERTYYTIAFVGVTGSGKSTAGNFLFAKKAFTSGFGFDRITTKCKAITSTIIDKNVRIIDTPGFFDSFTSSDIDLKELSEFLTIAKDGIHALAFVLSSIRFTKHCEEAVQRILQFKGVSPFTFVLLTHAESLGITKTATKEYIENCLSNPCCHPAFKKLMKLVDNRVFMVESVQHVGENYHVQKCNEFIALLENIHKNNGNRIYINAMLCLANEVYEKSAKLKQKEEKTKIERLYQSNCDKILSLKKRNNNIMSTAQSNAKVEILAAENRNLEKKLEKIKTKQYLDELTSEILYNTMMKSNTNGKDIAQFAGLAVKIFGIGAIGTSFYGVVGGLVGGMVGSIVPALGSAVGASAGFYIGLGFGGLGMIGVSPQIARDHYQNNTNKNVVINDDCKQQ